MEQQGFKWGTRNNVVGKEIREVAGNQITEDSTGHSKKDVLHSQHHERSRRIL